MATILKRQLANGAARYDAQIRRGGVTRKRSHRTRAAAERWARKIESEIDDRRDVPTAAESRTTVAEVLDAYAAEALDRLAWAPTVKMTNSPPGANFGRANQRDSGGAASIRDFRVSRSYSQISLPTNPVSGLRPASGFF